MFFETSYSKVNYSISDSDLTFDFIKNFRTCLVGHVVECKIWYSLDIERRFRKPSQELENDRKILFPTLWYFWIEYTEKKILPFENFQLQIRERCTWSWFYLHHSTPSFLLSKIYIQRRCYQFYHSSISLRVLLNTVIEPFYSGLISKAKNALWIDTFFFENAASQERLWSSMLCVTKTFKKTFRFFIACKDDVEFVLKQKIAVS